MCRPGWPAPSGELVALYDADGRPAGDASRERMRALNLTHAATAVVVRDPLGRVHVHRRTDTKDLYPGRHDFAAGGVVAAGEDPYDAAVRELEEELGVAGVALEPLGVAHFGDDHTDYWGHLFTAPGTARCGCSPRRSPGATGGRSDRLVAALDAEPDAWMPDTAGAAGRLAPRSRRRGRSTPPGGRGASVGCAA